MEEFEMLKIAFGCIDNTTLEGSDNDQKIITLCDNSKRLQDDKRGIPHVSSVCVYPRFVRLAKGQLEGSGIHVASVAGGFPAGQIPIEIKCAEVGYAVDSGADEIDMVISRGLLMQGEIRQVADEIMAIRDKCQGKILKVILETGELKEAELIRTASQIAIDAGADFIKTSTGKISVSATIEAATIMADVIANHYSATGKMVGLKVSGGISTVEQAKEYCILTKNILGVKFFNNQYFRIGASRLVNNLFYFLTK